MTYQLPQIAIMSLYLLLAIITSCLTQPSCASVINRDNHKISTESPENVESFYPPEWVSLGAQSQQIQIISLKLETKVRLRYARTRMIASLFNPHDKPLQATFKIILPQDAFFTIFKLKRGKEPKFHTASVMTKEDARNIFHYAHIKTNGSITAGFIELSNDDDMTSYNMKVTLGSRMNILTYLVYETQITRKSRMYPDELQIYPVEISTVDLLEYLVDVEEPEEISSLRCSDKTEIHYFNCSSNISYRSHKRAELLWRDTNVTSKFMRAHPFGFQYELNQQNVSTAFVIHQRNGNVYFVHLFVPENLPQIRRHVIFLLDVSDSMHGKKMDQLKWAMIEILDDLAPHDFFSIVTFSNEVTVWSKYAGDRRKCPIPHPANEAFKDAARYYIETKMTAYGTTNIYLGMTTAFDLAQLFSPLSNETCAKAGEIKSPSSIIQKDKNKLPENTESMIFFLSDGNATSGPRDPRVLLNSFHKLNHEKLIKPLPIYSIAFGQNADFEFLKMLSSENGGTYKFIPENSAGGIELANYYAEISSHILSRIQLVFSNNNDTSGEIKHTSTTASLVLINGTEMLTAGEIYVSSKNNRWSSKNLSIEVEAAGANGMLRYQSPVYDCRTLETTLDYCLDKLDLFLERLQAYQLLKKLMIRDKKVQMGYSCPKSLDEDFYTQNLEDYYGYEDQECLNPFKDQITELAMKSHFITPYTSFILCSGPNVDVGLKGHIDMKVPRGKGTGDGISTDATIKFSVSDSSDDKLTDKDGEKSENNVVPVPAKLISSADNVVDIENHVLANVHSTDLSDVRKYSNKTVSDNNVNSNWYSKNLQDFAALFFRKILIPKHPSYNVTNSRISNLTNSLNDTGSISI